MKKKYGKNIGAFFISLILMFVLLITSITMFFRGSILNPQTYIGVLEKYNIYDDIYENIYSNLDYLLLTNNMTEGMLNGVINKDEVIQVVNDSIYYTVGYMKNEQQEIPDIDIKIYEDRLNRSMDKFLIENSMYLNEEFRNSLSEFKLTVVNIIKSDLELINLNEVSKSSAMKVVAKVSTIIDSGMFVVGLLLIDVIICSLFFILWKRRKARRFVWIGYSFVSCGLMVALVGFSGYVSGFYEHIAIAIPYVATAVGFIIKKCLLDLTGIGCIVLFIGVCFMSIYWKHLFKKYKIESSLNTSKGFN
ncbi:MAG: hypothetical protein ACRC3Y_16525 [Romboutsia sp.]|uniref:hypothetical protein n=1 Tax=Romboutsia sp. TaxID=1965302 RepID=UPI003F3FD3F9